MAYKYILKAGALALLLGSVAACGDNNSDPVPEPPISAPPPAPPPPPTTGTFQSRFGAAFAAIFNRSSTQDPVDPKPGDVPPLAPASDPLDNS